MTALILLEAAINQLWRGRAQNLADSVTSISSGLLMTAAGLSTRLLMVGTIFALFLDIRSFPLIVADNNHTIVKRGKHVRKYWEKIPWANFY